MFSRLRHIGKMVVGALLVMRGKSCVRWRESLGIFLFFIEYMCKMLNFHI